jgi:PEGA domain
MKAFSLKLGIAVAALLLTAGPVLAQAGGDRGSAGGGDRGGGGGSTTTSGGGMSAGTGGGGSVSSGGGGGGSSSGGGGGGGFSSPSSSGFSSPSISMGDRSFRTTAPEHRVNFSQNGARSHTASSGSSGDQATARPSGGSSSNGAPSRGNAGSADRGAAPRSESGGGERAVARGAGAAGREPAAARDNGGNRRMNEGTNNASGANEVPTWSRPRGDRPATDVAVTRVGPQPPRDAHDRQRGYGSCCYSGDGGGYYYDPYYYGGYGYGFGYGFYDRAFYGYPFYSPFGFGYGIPLGYFDPFYADPYDYGGGYGAYSSNVYGGHDQGQLKLKVKPRNAKVYVDGYYVGLVDEFDGAFQKLTLNGGRHKVELRAEGYETTEFDVLVTPEQTVTFAGDMKKVQ